jgi:hypothetical protein
MMVNNERKLATIQRIINIQAIENADKIELTTVLGWQVVVKKNEFKVGDLCIYIEIDSIVPDIPYFEFMRDRKFRVRTIKLRGQISQGLIVKIQDLLSNKKFKENDDVTNLIGVKKYDPEKIYEEKQINDKKIKNPILKYLYRFKIVRYFLKPTARKFPYPSYIIPKTDEKRIQNIPNVINELQGEEVYITEKLDGQSATYILYKNKFMVCSRNMNLPKNNSNWWQIAKQFDIENKLKQFKKLYGIEIAIQGEIIGEGIQKNKYQIEGKDFYLFNVYNIKYKRYFNFVCLTDFCKDFNFNIVPLIDKKIFTFDMKSLIKFSNQNSNIGNTLQEGIVVRNLDMDKNKVSFKVINPEFLLKYNL